MRSQFSSRDKVGPRMHAEPRVFRLGGAAFAAATRDRWPWRLASSVLHGRRGAISARVDRVDEPLIVGLSQPEVPSSRLDPQRSVTNLADVAGITGAVSFCAGTGDRNIAAFEIERLLVELIERLGERLDIDARPHRVRGVGIKRAEGVLVAIERQSNGPRFCRQGSHRRGARGRNNGWWCCRTRS